MTTKTTESLVSPVWYRYTNVVAERGEGVYLYDADGTAYLDFTSGIGVTNTGHAHPRVVAAVQEQAARLLHGQANIVFHPALLKLVEKLQEVVPAALGSFFFSNSGAEAVEAAVKLARQSTGRPNVVVFQGSFHGRTVGTMSLTTSKTIYRAGYQPLMPGAFVAPYPYVYRYGWDEAETVAWCLKELRLLLKTQTAPFETAAVLVEPVLGEGGYVIPPDGFLQGLREICDEHDLLLIFDEVQSGFGRTGKFWGYEHWPAEPDVIVMAKGLASGLPLSGIAARPDLMDRWTPGSHGGTYGANAVACAAAVATLEVIQEDGLVENAARMGDYLTSRLRDLQARQPIVGDVRGRGLMVGVEFTHPNGDPATEVAKVVLKGALKRHMLLLTCGPYDNTVRWIPPLVVSKDELDEGLNIFEAALAEAV